MSSVWEDQELLQGSTIRMEAGVFDALLHYLKQKGGMGVGASRFAVEKFERSHKDQQYLDYTSPMADLEKKDSLFQQGSTRRMH